MNGTKEQGLHNGPDFILKDTKTGKIIGIEAVEYGRKFFTFYSKHSNNHKRHDDEII
jgi:hypothetical protein